MHFVGGTEILKPTHSYYLFADRNFSKSDTYPQYLKTREIK